ncbi:hypothetical protein TNCT_351851 [Trichonephila clavata]|uniref:Uncharacterized protein n=1 Tax=Trichonephila clavata TaxID=2740835 RepID=A0A8X6LN87_TRICU|nr:hypothetical protein TNCT_351851 [Trichonephila clavata]
MKLSATVEALFGQEFGEPRFQRPPLSHLLRAVSVTAFRMRTEHDYLDVHLHRINVLPTPEGQLCGYGTRNAEHRRTFSALDHSKNYQNSIFKEAHLYWSVCHLIAQQPRVGVS